MYNYGFGFPWFIFGWIFWVAIFILIFALLSGHRHRHWHGNYWQHWQGHEHEGTSDPMGIIKERYAKGEINKEEFDRLKKDLQDSH